MYLVLNITHCFINYLSFVIHYLIRTIFSSSSPSLPPYLYPPTRSSQHPQSRSRLQALRPRSFFLPTKTSPQTLSGCCRNDRISPSGSRLRIRTTLFLGNRSTTTAATAVCAYPAQVYVQWGIQEKLFLWTTVCERETTASRELFFFIQQIIQYFYR